MVSSSAFHPRKPADVKYAGGGPLPGGPRHLHSRIIWTISNVLLRWSGFCQRCRMWRRTIMVGMVARGSVERYLTKVRHPFPQVAIWFKPGIRSPRRTQYRKRRVSGGSCHLRRDWVMFSSLKTSRTFMGKSCAVGNGDHRCYTAERVARNTLQPEWRRLRHDNLTTQCGWVSIVLGQSFHN